MKPHLCTATHPTCLLVAYTRGIGVAIYHGAAQLRATDVAFPGACVAKDREPWGRATTPARMTRATCFTSTLIAWAPTLLRAGGVGRGVRYASLVTPARRRRRSAVETSPAIAARRETLSASSGEGLDCFQFLALRCLRSGVWCFVCADNRYCFPETRLLVKSESTRSR